MGYLGGYPYTETTAQKVDDFNGGAPPPPAPGRRAQYSYMAVPLTDSTADNMSNPAPIKEMEEAVPLDDFDDGGFEDDAAFDVGTDDPFLADDIFDKDPPIEETGNYADWDDL